MNQYEVRLFGGLSIQENSQEVEGFASEKAKLVLAYLLYMPGPHPRERLAAMLWENSGAKQAANNLRTVLTSLRQSLPEQIHEDNRSLSLQMPENFWVDINVFRHASASTPYTFLPIYELLQGKQSHESLSGEAVTALKEALLLYRGELLYGVNLRSASGYEAWLSKEREHCHLMALHAADQLASHYLLTGDWQASLTWATRIVDIDELAEEGYRKLMVLLWLTGQRQAAIAEYDKVTSLLERELDVSPAPETTTLFEQIRDGTLDVGSLSNAQNEQWSPIVIVPPRQEIPHNLQRSIAPFVGREEELAQIKQCLALGDRRLITIIGPGGMGKTRLAEEVAWQCWDSETAREQFHDGIFFIPLASTLTCAYIPYAIAQPLKVDLDGSMSPEQALINALKKKRLLLVLDNFEHLMDGRDLIQQLLQGAPHVNILITSREALLVRGEWRQMLDGLPYQFTTPMPDSLSLDSFGESWPELPASLKLFLNVANQSAPAFRLTSDNLSYAQEICRLLDGLPLGIELAAALVDRATCESIAQAVAKNKDHLAATLWDVPARHRTLRAVFEHSWALLSPQQQSTLIRLAIFKGSFSYEAAQTIVREWDADLPDAVLSEELLEELVHKSLFKRSAKGRYRSHAALYQYIAEKLAESPDVQTELASRHAAYYANVITSYDRLLVSDHGAETLRQMAREIRNIRQAWEWGITHQAIQLLEPMIAPITQYFHLRGASAMGENFLANTVEMLKQLDKQTPSLAHIESKILVSRSRFQQNRSDYVASIESAKAAIELAEVADAKDVMAQAYYSWGITLTRQGDSSAALVQIQEAYRLAQESDDPVLMGHSLYQLAAIEWQLGHYDKSHEFVDSAEEIYTEIDDYRGKGNLYVLKGILASHEGDFTASCDYYDRALALYKEIGNLYGQGFAYANAGRAWAEQGMYAKARRYYARALQISQEAGNQFTVGNVLLSLGRDAVLTGDFLKAETFLQQAMAQKVAAAERRGQSEILAYYSLLAEHQGDYRSAQAAAMDALKLANEIKDQSMQAFAHMNLGLAYEGISAMDEAEEAFQASLQLRQSLGQTNLAMEPLAGLARVTHQKGAVNRAHELIEQLSEHLTQRTLDGTDDPVRVFYTCFTLLYETRPTNARQLLLAGYNLLQSRATNITEENVRTYYFSQISSHRATLELYAQHIRNKEGP